MRTVTEIVEQISAQYAEDIMTHVNDSWALDIIIKSVAADAYKAELEDVIESQREVQNSLLVNDEGVDLAEFNHQEETEARYRERRYED